MKRIELLALLVAACFGVAGMLHAQANIVLDPEFNMPPETTSSNVHAAVVLPDGKIMTCGSYKFMIAGEERHHNLMRLNPDGTVDGSFNTVPPWDSTEAINFNHVIYSLAVLPDEKVLAWGSFERIQGEDHVGLARLHPDGGIDVDFAAEFPDVVGHEFWDVLELAVLEDGKLLAHVRYWELGTDDWTIRLLRLLSDGSLDADLTAELTRPDWFFRLLSEPEGNVLVLAHLGGDAEIERLLPDGTKDNNFTTISLQASDFDPSRDGLSVSSAVALPDGSLLLGLSLFDQGSTSGADAYVVRLDASGAIDPGFSQVHVTHPTGFNAGISAITPQADGRILITGIFQYVDGEPRSHIARLLPNGGLDTGFNPGDGYSPILGLIGAALQADGRMLVYGVKIGPDSATFDSQPVESLFRLLNTGSATHAVAYKDDALQWTVGGTAPVLLGARYEYSTDGVDYTDGGQAFWNGSAWEAPIDLSQGVYHVRAIGTVSNMGMLQNVSYPVIHEQVITVDLPIMEVTRGGSPVVNGGTVDIGLYAVGAAVTMHYTIANVGDAALVLAGGDAVQISGQQNCVVAIVTMPAQEIAEGEDSVLSVNVVAGNEGPFSFQLTILSNHFDNVDFGWTVTGQAVVPTSQDSKSGGGCATGGQGGLLGLVALLLLVARRRRPARIAAR